MGKRQIAALQTKQNVLIAAEKLIAERGFENVTIQDIAKEAGVATGTFYTYFKRKEDVVAAIAHTNFASVQEQARKTDDEITKKIEVFLVDSMKYIVDTGLKIAQQWTRNIMEPSEYDGKSKLIYDMSVIKEMLEAAVEKGELRDDTPIEELHKWITAEYYGIGLCWCIMDGATDPIALLEGYCRTQLKNSLLCYIKN